LILAIRIIVKMRPKLKKYEYRNPKWFDWLTILSEVEGQYQNSNFQNSKQK